MKDYAFRCQFVYLLMATALGAVGCSPRDTPARNRAIEGALNQTLTRSPSPELRSWSHDQVLEIPTGTELRITGNTLADLKKAESSGLVELRHPSWMEAGLVEVVATAKLLGVALNPDAAWTAKDSEQYLGGEAGGNKSFIVRVRIRQATMEKILTDEEYKGPLASPGEKHRLLLGTFRNAPTSTAAVVGPGLAWQDEISLRFRCVVKYSEFKKDWSVVALDVGSIDPEQWFGSKVR
jgi:hypothetical protein